jgi:hypothetical protein
LKIYKTRLRQRTDRRRQAYIPQKPKNSSSITSAQTLDNENVYPADRARITTTDDCKYTPALCLHPARSVSGTTQGYAVFLLQRMRNCETFESRQRCLHGTGFLISRMSHSQLTRCNNDCKPSPIHWDLAYIGIMVKLFSCWHTGSDRFLFFNCFPLFIIFFIFCL